MLIKYKNYVKYLLDMDWNLISFVTGSNVRFKILLDLKKSNKTPTELSKNNNLFLSAASRALNELKERDLVICLTTDKSNKKRYYQISEKGKEILERISKETSFDY